MGFLDRFLRRAASAGTPGETARIVGGQYLAIKRENPQATDRDIFEVIVEARHQAEPYTPEQLARLKSAVNATSVHEFIAQLLLVEANLRAQEIQGGPLDNLVAAVGEELRKMGLARPTRAQWLARFLNAYWGVHKTPEGFAAKLKDDLSIENVDPDELWAYVSFLVANSALGKGFSQEEVNEFFNLASMDRGSIASYDRLSGLVERRVPQYIEVFSSPVLEMEGGMIAAMRTVAENVSGASDIGLRMMLSGMASDITGKMAEFVKTLG